MSENLFCLFRVQGSPSTSYLFSTYLSTCFTVVPVPVSFLLLRLLTDDLEIFVITVCNDYSMKHGPVSSVRYGKVRCRGDAPETQTSIL